VNNRGSIHLSNRYDKTQYRRIKTEHRSRVGEYGFCSGRVFTGILENNKKRHGLWKTFVKWESEEGEISQN